MSVLTTAKAADPQARLAAALRDLETRTDDMGVAAWTLVLEDRESVSLGAKDKQVGGVYAPPKVTRTLGGDLYVVWKAKVGGETAVSKTSVDALWLRDIGASLKRLRARAYAEKFVVDLPEDRPLPEVAVWDERVVSFVREDPSFGFDLLGELRPRLSRAKASWSADVGAGLVHRRVQNSKGLDRQSRTTRMAFGAEADSLFGIGTERRDLLSRETVASRLDRLNEWLPHFEPKEIGGSAREPVLLLPGAAASFLGHFVLANLDGESVANGQSAWSAADFTARKRVFSPDLTLRFDPLEDWRPWSYQLDRRGIPAERRSYLEGGALASPIVSLKAAKQLSCAPTPVPSSSGLTIEMRTRGELDRIVSGLERGVIVPDVLGMHTQAAARGAYSLSVPRALVVRGGKIVGASKAVLSGNFFEDLGRDDLVAFSTPADDSSGLAFEGTVKLT